MTNLTVTLPKPYELQREILKHPAKRKVIAAGRRAGKTTLAAIAASMEFLQGNKVLISSTTQDQADVFWDKARLWFAPLVVNGVVRKNEVKRTLEFGTARIRVKTGSNPDVLRGDDADLIIFDECAILDPRAWFEVAAPMLADRDGDAIFISSPRRRNWFYQLYGRALSDDTGRWHAWNFTSMANPHISSEALEDLTRDMTRQAYQQEILAEFLEGEGAVFRRIRECIVDDDQPNTGNGRYVMGVDWAQKSDYTVLTVLDKLTGRVIEIDRFNQIGWSLQRGRLEALYSKYGDQIETIIAEENAIGSPNIEALQLAGLPVQPFTTTSASKPPLIESLVLAFERGEISIPNDRQLILELEAYERMVGASGRPRYSAPEGLHDDMVMSLALAWHGKINHVERWVF